MRDGVLYLVTSPSGKRYVGVTSLTAERRWSRHLVAARRGSNQAIHAAIRKYDETGFRVQALVRASMDYLFELESKAIEVYGTRAPLGYNLNAGGEGGQHGLTDEQRRTRSDAARETWRRSRAKILAGQEAARCRPGHKERHRLACSLARRNHA